MIRQGDNNPGTLELVREVSATLPVEKDAITIRLDQFPDLPTPQTWRNIVRVLFELKTPAKTFLIGPIEKH